MIVVPIAANVTTKSALLEKEKGGNDNISVEELAPKILCDLQPPNSAVSSSHRFCPFAVAQDPNVFVTAPSHAKRKQFDPVHLLHPIC